MDIHTELTRLAIEPEAEGLGKPVEIHLKSRIAEVNTEGGIITLENGETAEGDVIIGADGIHVRVRALRLSLHCR